MKSSIRQGLRPSDYASGNNDKSLLQSFVGITENELKFVPIGLFLDTRSEAKLRDGAAEAA